MPFSFRLAFRFIITILIALHLRFSLFHLLPPLTPPECYIFHDTPPIFIFRAPEPAAFRRHYYADYAAAGADITPIR
jgi:hypothetical protein